MYLGRRAHLVNRDARDQFGSSVARSSIGVDDDRSLPGKLVQDAALNLFNDRPNRFGIVVSRQAHKDIHFADVDQLTKKIIRKKGLVFQFHSLQSLRHIRLKAPYFLSLYGYTLRSLNQ